MTSEVPPSSKTTRFCFCLHRWCPINFLQPLSFLEVLQGSRLLREGLRGADVSERGAPKSSLTSFSGISCIAEQDTHWRTIQLLEIKNSSWLVWAYAQGSGASDLPEGMLKCVDLPLRAKHIMYFMHYMLSILVYFALTTLFVDYYVSPPSFESWIKLALENK